MGYMWLKWLHLFSVIAAMGWMVMSALVLHGHNQAPHPNQTRLERLLLGVGYALMSILVFSGILMVLDQFTIMRSDWFYLKLFVLAPLLAQFFHFRGVMRETRIVHLGYSPRYFLLHLGLTLTLIGVVLALSLFKPL